MPVLVIDGDDVRHDDVVEGGKPIAFVRILLLGLSWVHSMPLISFQFFAWSQFGPCLGVGTGEGAGGERGSV